MNTNAHLILVLLLSHPLAAFGALEFGGYLSDSRTVRFLLADTETGVHSTWLEIGQSFQHHKIVEFDSKSEILTVAREARTLRLPLRMAKTREGRSVGAPNSITISIGGQTSILVRDDPAFLADLESELRRAAAVAPRPTIAIRASEKASASVVKALFDLCRNLGLQKVSLSPP